MSSLVARLRNHRFQARLGVSIHAQRFDKFASCILQILNPFGVSPLPTIGNQLRVRGVR